MNLLARLASTFQFGSESSLSHLLLCHVVGFEQLAVSISSP